MFKSKIRYLPPRKGERYASVLTKISLSNPVHKMYGKIKLKDYINSVTNKPSLQKWILIYKVFEMKIASSLKSLKKRDLNSKLVKRRGRVYIINKKNPKFKARQK